MITVDVYNMRGERAQRISTEAVVLINSNDEDEFDYSDQEYDVLYVNTNNVMMVHVVEDKPEDDATSEDAGRISEGTANDDEETSSVPGVSFASSARRIIDNALQMQSRSFRGGRQP